jgi:hypothetical protein
MSLLRSSPGRVANSRLSLSLGVFELLTLHAQGKRDAALAAALILIAENVQTEEMKRYEASIRGNAEYLAGLDH